MSVGDPATETGPIVRTASYDVSGLLPGNALLQDTVVDYEGRLWFAATTGEVGYVDPVTEAAAVFSTGEGRQNSLQLLAPPEPPRSQFVAWNSWIPNVRYWGIASILQLVRAIR